MSMRDLMPWSSGGTPRPGGDNPLLGLQRDINRVFEETWKRFESLGPFAGRGGPKVDVAETDDTVEVTVELPGVDAKDLDLSLTETALTIKGERKSEREEKKKDYVLSERSWGSFVRTIPLPSAVAPDQADATFAKGVLTVTLPKAPEAKEKVRKIAVKAA